MRDGGEIIPARAGEETGRIGRGGWCAERSGVGIVWLGGLSQCPKPRYPCEIDLAC